MELKVWVEGIQRVVCGISEQTTVQEVVIALAQATGRTGRYTLVEKWRDMEKLLPPTEHPIKVLSKWGEYAAEVQFLLKRTGASTVSSDTENMRGPERNVYRQSLPPQNRQKSELLQGLKRKEPKRKSLTITGGTPAYFGTESPEIRNQSNNNNKGLEFPTIKEDVKPSMLKSSVVVSKYDAGTANGKKTDVSRSAEKDRTQNTASPKDSKRKNKDLKSKSKQEQDKKGKQEQKNSKQPLLPPHMKKKDGKASVPSATAVLFPSESKSEVAAKSPIKKNQENLFNKSNGNTKKVPLMPPSNKILRSRTEGNGVDQGQLVSASTSFIPSHTRNNSSGSVPFNPLPQTNSNKLDVSSTHYGNSLPRSGKKPWSEWRSMDDWKTADGGRSENNLAKQKSPLMPPHSHRKHSSSRLRSPPPTPTNFHPGSHSTDRSQTPLSSVTRNTEYNRAVDEFSRLGLEQQKHIEEQQETVKALDGEVRGILQKMHKIESEVQDEVDQLKERNKLLDPLEDDAKLAQELYAEEKRNANVQREMDQLQSEIDHTNAKLTDYKRIIENLTTEIANERYRLQLKQQKEEQEENRRLMVKVKQDMDRATREVDSMEDEFRRTENECFMKNQDIDAKYAELESLNRELRQVKLQQFIRQTGSKVTVLPPNAEDLNNHIQSRPATFVNQKGSRPPVPSAVGQRGGSEGVWV